MLIYYLNSSFFAAVQIYLTSVVYSFYKELQEEQFENQYQLNTIEIGGKSQVPDYPPPPYH